MTIMSVQRICPRCRAANAAEATICRACGANINDKLAVTRFGGLALPAITRREGGATVAVATAALALRLAQRLLGNRLTRPGPAPVSSPATALSAEQKAPGVTVVRRTWWHVSRSDGSSHWGSQQDTWEIEPHDA